MSEQAITPFIPGEQQPIEYVPPPAPVSIWKIAAAVFVGNLLCGLISAGLYFCLLFGGIILASASPR